MVQAKREEMLRMVAIYNERLEERERRRAFVADRGLLNVKAQQVRARCRPATSRAGLLLSEHRAHPHLTPVSP